MTTQPEQFLRTEKLTKIFRSGDEEIVVLDETESGSSRGRIRGPGG